MAQREDGKWPTTERAPAILRAIVRQRSTTAGWVLTAALSSCRFPPTQVTVVLDTDIPREQMLTVRAEVVPGAGTAGPLRDPVQWRVGSAPGEVQLPATFGVVPGALPRGSLVTLTIEAAAASTGPGRPALRILRRARFAFAARRSQQIRVFLTQACGDQAYGCTGVDVEQCTVSTFCAERGLTCGDRGRCVSIDVVPSATDAGAPADTDLTPDSLIAAPSPRTPASASRVTSRRPTLRWRPIDPGTGAIVEVCRDRACALLESVIRVESGDRARPSDNLEPGTTFWRVRSTRGASIGRETSAAWMMIVPARDTPLDTWHGIVSDYDGDGRADVAIGAPSATTMAGREAGSVRIVPGAARGSVAVRTLSGAAAGGRFGWSLAAAGDVDGDGFVDLVVGAPMASGGDGRAYVFRGGRTGLTESPAWVFSLPDSGAEFGRAVAGVGDINADGFADIAIGAPRARADGRDGAGRVAVYFGGRDGPQSTPSADFLGLAIDDALGLAIAGAGDANGDGFADVAIAANGVAEGGRVQLYTGSDVALSGRPDRTLLGAARRDHFGQQIDLDGDVNGDGFADLLVGAPNADPDGLPEAGAVFVFAGSSSGPPPAPSREYDGASGEHLGFSVAHAGDFDGDGIDDAIFGAPNARVGALEVAGLIRVHRGGPDGLVAASPLVVSGMRANGALGISVAGCGDTDGDDLVDVVAGALLAAGSSGTAGGAIVVPGRRSGNDATERGVIGETTGDGFGFTVARGAGGGRRIAPGARRTLPILAL